MYIRSLGSRLPAEPKTWFCNNEFPQKTSKCTLLLNQFQNLHQIQLFLISDHTICIVPMWWFAIWYFGCSSGISMITFAGVSIVGNDQWWLTQNQTLFKSKILCYTICNIIHICWMGKENTLIDIYSTNWNVNTIGNRDE